MMQSAVRTFANMDQMTAFAVRRIGGRLRRAMRREGRVGMAVSGGKTPKKLLMRLSAEPLDWKRVVVTLTDERWVPVSDPESNEYMLRQTLLRDRAADCQFIGLKTRHTHPSEAETTCRRHLEGMPNPFELVILGMGTDGHVASLFPGEPRGLAPGFAGYCLATQAPVPPKARMSLSLRRLLSSKWIVVWVSGEEKRRVIEAVLSAGSDLPIAAVLGQDDVPVDVFWCPESQPGKGS